MILYGEMEEMNMREMTKTERIEIEFQVTEIMRSATSSEYVRYILEQYDETSEQTFMNAVIVDVMETSAWEDEGYYNDDDIRLAIGRELMARLGIEV